MDKKDLVTRGHTAERQRKKHVTFLKKFFPYFSTNEYSMAEKLVIKHAKTKGSLLEVGSSEGIFCLRMASAFQSVTGIDIVGQNILKARADQKRKKITNVKFLEADIEEADIEKNRHDVIACINAMEYFYDPYKVLIKFKDSLKKDGLLILQVPNIAFLPVRIKHLFGKLPRASLIHTPREWDSGMLHYYTKKELIRLLKATGFDIIETTCSGFFQPLRKMWVGLLGWDIMVACRPKK